MRPSGFARRRRNCAAAITIALAMPAPDIWSQTTSTPNSAEFDIIHMRKALEKSRADAQEALRASGKATADKFREIDEKMIDRARRAEAQRTEAVESLSKQAGGANINQGGGGTKPTEGRGGLGDIDTDSLSPSEFVKVRDAAKKAGYEVTGEGDAFTIEGLDVTVHRKTVREMSYGSSEQVGSSGHAAETAGGSNRETAYGLNQKDPSLNVADNLKKAAHTLDMAPESLEPADLQKLGKMTERNMTAIRDVTNSAGDPVLRQQAELLKQGYSPESAGIVRENATPEERAADIADFQRRSREVAQDAVRAGDQHASQEMDRLAGETRKANDALQAARESGDPEAIAAAKKNVMSAESELVNYQEAQAVAHQSAVLNDTGAAKVIDDARGIDTAGKTPSQLREAAVAPEQKALVNRVENAPASEVSSAPAEGVNRAPETSPVVEVPVGAGARLMNGLKGALGIYAVYEGVKRGATEAGKEAEENGDSDLKSTAKTVGYSAWYGLGIGSAIETGKKSGEESAQQWAEDVKAGKIDPNSRFWRYEAQLRGALWGVAEFTGLQAIKDATVEGTGLIKDRFNQYQAEKGETAQNAADAQRDADRATKNFEKLAAERAAADNTGPDTSADKNVADKAALDKTAADRTAADKASADKLAADEAAAEKVAADKVAADKAAADKLVAEKTRADRLAAKLAAEQAAADKAAADKAAADLAAADKAAVDKAALEQQQQAQPPLPPTPPGTTLVESGVIADKNGPTKLFYVKDANGNTIGGYYIHYDKQGREIGRESFKETPGSPTEQQPAATLGGRYEGSIHGKSAGTIVVNVSGGSVSGSLRGVHEGDSFSANFSGALNGDGSFDVAASGVLQGNWGDHVTPYPLSGRVSGRVDGRTGAGRWSGKNQWGSDGGSWQASK